MCDPTPKAVLLLPIFSMWEVEEGDGGGVGDGGWGERLEDNNCFKSLQSKPMWRDSVGFFFHHIFFSCAAPVDLSITSWSTHMQPAMRHGREMLRKYCNTYCDLSSKPKNKSKCHMQLIPLDLKIYCNKIRKCNC